MKPSITSILALALISAAASEGLVPRQLADRLITPAYADSPDAQAQDQLTSLTSLLDQITQQGLQQADEGRILILKQAAQKVLDSLSTKGLGNMQTINRYQELIVKFRYSAQFFQFIRTQSTEDAIKQVLATVEQIRKDRGFDDTPYTQFLKSNLSEMVNAIRMLLKDPVLEPAVGQKLKALLPLFADAIAQGDQGDRPHAFAAATEVFKQMRGLYPTLQTLHASQPSSQLALEIMGLNEMVGEYAQVGE
jgi:hypothetical protein